jgi:hypothetical protein
MRAEVRFRNEHKEHWVITLRIKEMIEILRKHSNRFVIALALLILSFGSWLDYRLLFKLH